MSEITSTSTSKIQIMKDECYKYNKYDFTPQIIHMDNVNSQYNDDINVYSYTYEYDRIVNIGLRSGTIGDTGLKTMNILDNTFLNVPPITKDITIFRGLANYVPKIGEIIREKGYSSFSESYNTSMDFLQENYLKGTILITVLPKGSKVLFYADECEVLLNRGLVLQVKEIFTNVDNLNDDTVNMAVCEIIEWNQDYQIIYCPNIDIEYNKLCHEIINSKFTYITEIITYKGNKYYEIVNKDTLTKHKSLYIQYIAKDLHLVKTNIPKDSYYRSRIIFPGHLMESFEENLEKLYEQTPGTYFVSRTKQRTTIPKTKLEYVKYTLS